jgi:hypothetical protein
MHDYQHGHTRDAAARGAHDGDLADVGVGEGACGQGSSPLNLDLLARLEKNALQQFLISTLNLSTLVKIDLTMRKYKRAYQLANLEVEERREE